jgi:hypothetical protein
VSPVGLPALSQGLWVALRKRGELRYACQPDFNAGWQDRSGPVWLRKNWYYITFVILTLILIYGYFHG